MKNVLVSSCALAFVLNASAQSSSAPAASVSSTSTIQQSAAKTGVANPWSGSVSLNMDTDAYWRTTRDQNSPMYDRDAVYVDSITSVGLGYKFASGNSLGLVQRIFYSQNIDSSRQLNAALGDLRIHYTTPIQALGGKGALVTRIAPATTWASFNDDNRLGAIALMPSLGWDLTPKLAIKYSGYFGGVFWNGPKRELSDYNRLMVSDAFDAGYRGRFEQVYKASYESAIPESLKSKSASDAQVLTEEEQTQINSAKAQASQMAQMAAQTAGLSAAQKSQTSMLTKPADQRNFYSASNTVAVEYKLTEKISISQSLGYTLVTKNYTNDSKDASRGIPTATAMFMELGTGVSYAPLKNVSVDLSVGQSHPFLAGSADPVTGKPITWRDGFSPYIAEQTQFVLNTAVRF